MGLSEQVQGWVIRVCHDICAAEFHAESCSYQRGHYCERVKPSPRQHDGLRAGCAKRKGLYRCIEKVTLAAHGKFKMEQLWDVARNGVVAENIAMVLLALERLVALHN